ncbi:hypothetical protein KDW_55830 [Dictyobacter vulcani]|uniref:Uncharacterized protein n=1 Tax=Dictyobacter vulcani TaxID=2607529 RepID=A0A5J4KY40_9CHLR|nr:hypothetical protein KDW_55830 [Dictyobacter vulcani]
MFAAKKPPMILKNTINNDILKNDEACVKKLFLSWTLHALKKTMKFYELKREVLYEIRDSTCF